MCSGTGSVEESPSNTGAGPEQRYALASERGEHVLSQQGFGVTTATSRVPLSAELIVSRRVPAVSVDSKRRAGTENAASSSLYKPECCARVSS